MDFTCVYWFALSTFKTFQKQALLPSTWYAAGYSVRKSHTLQHETAHMKYHFFFLSEHFQRTTRRWLCELHNTGVCLFSKKYRWIISRHWLPILKGSSHFITRALWQATFAQPWQGNIQLSSDSELLGSGFEYRNLTATYIPQIRKQSTKPIKRQSRTL